MVSFTHAHTPTAAASPRAPGRRGCGFLSARQGRWVGGEGSEELGEGVEGEPQSLPAKREKAEALRRGNIPSPFSRYLPTSPPPSDEPFQPPSLSSSRLLRLWLRR